MGQAPSAFQVTSSSALPESRKSIRRSKTRRSTRSLPSTQCVSRNHLMQHNEPKGRSCKDCGLVDPTANLPLNLITSDNWVRNAAPYYVETKLKTVSGPRSLDLSLRRHVDKVNTCSRFQYVPVKMFILQKYDLLRRNVQRGDSWSEVASDMYRFTRNSHPRCCRLKTNVEERRKCSSNLNSSFNDIICFYGLLGPLREESLMRPSSQNSSVCSRNSTSIAAVSKRASQPASSINHRPPKNVGQTEMQWSYNGLTPSIPHTQIVSCYSNCVYASQGSV
ncbi:hypothetical protein D918_09969 [Trichuris suis]|nr:hypothetical protein D918_09969 [Trichuris suis]